MIWWLVLIAVMVACAIGGAVYLRQARESGEVERLREAIEELEAEVGKAFLPIIEATVMRLERWLNRNKGS